MPGLKSKSKTVRPWHQNKMKRSKRHQRMMRYQMSCPLCHVSTYLGEMMMAGCGHPLCCKCYRAALRQDTACPTCGVKITKRKRIFSSNFKQT